jgi:peptide/nickel transport system substrate-binding protein
MDSSSRRRCFELLGDEVETGGQEMAGHTTETGRKLSRRAFLATTGGALAGVGVLGLVEPAAAAKRYPGRGGMLRFATRGDATGLDPHRNTYYLVSNPLAAISQGLLDLNLHAEPVPGVATEWEVSKDLRTYTFKLRQGVLFHNGREVDAAAVQWNYQRLKDPKTSHPLMRATLANLQEVEVVEKYTLRCHLNQPSAAFPANVVYYPCNLIAPDSAEQADMRPIGCGPFRFVKWARNQVTEVVRFENYFETDAEGNSLPYLDGILGRPKKEDRVRLISFRAGEVDLIDTMAFSDAANFAKRYAKKYQTWDVPMLGTAYLVFNLDQGPFTDKRVRQAAAHAIEREAINQVVFYGCGDIANGFYAPVSPWYVAAATSPPEYNPDKAKFLLRQARAVGTEVVLQALSSYPYIQQTGDLVQAMLTDVGFKVVYHIDDAPMLRQRRRNRTFHLEPTSTTYRFDPDGWFSNAILSTSPTTRMHSGFHNERADKLVAEARQTANKPKRLELYAEIENIVNEELPLLYIHHVTLLEAGAMNLKGYQPAISGAFSTRGAGIRTAWLA